MFGAWRSNAPKNASACDERHSAIVISTHIIPYSYGYELLSTTNKHMEEKQSVCFVIYYVINAILEWISVMFTFFFSHFSSVKRRILWLLLGILKIWYFTRASIVLCIFLASLTWYYCCSLSIEIVECGCRRGSYCVSPHWMHFKLSYSWQNWFSSTLFHYN